MPRRLFHSYPGVSPSKEWIDHRRQRAFQPPERIIHQR
jgi:hypothetical protein